MNILGISCFYHDSAACLIKDGKIAAAAQEERFNRKKNTADFPIQAINFCVNSLTSGLYDIDYIGFYEKPYLKFSRVVYDHLQSFPFSLKNLLEIMPLWLEDRLILPLVFKRELGFKGKTFFIKHHLSHAASSFLVSPFDEAAIITADGVGEWATTTVGSGKGNTIDILKEINFPDSLGLLYTAITTYLGFEALEGEGKVMGLAGYGEPGYLDKLKEIVMVNSDGSFKLDQKYFGFFNAGSRMFTPAFIKVFGKPRQPDESVQDRHRDMAASLQALIEEVVVMIARNLHNETKLDKLCLAGGLFLNCIINHKILEETPFKKIFIQPASGDSGGSLGAASYIYHCLLGNKRENVLTSASLGPEFSPAQIRRVLDKYDLVYKEMEFSDLARYIAEKIFLNEIVGWFQGKMEFGPRALGNRSILANPCNERIKDILNSKVKKRESFRPYAPVVTEENAADYFELKDSSPFMLLAPQIKNDKKKFIPGIVHVDGTARVQTANKNLNPKIWHLLREFEKISGVPIMVNTSLNLRGEPIVCSPEDAVSVYLNSEMDCLVLENMVVVRGSTVH